MRFFYMGCIIPKSAQKYSTCGKDFKKAEEKYEVNAILLMGMAKHETGNGHSYLAKTKNNLFGFNAIDQDPINSANTFKDKGESIDHVAISKRKLFK